MKTLDGRMEDAALAIWKHPNAGNVTLGEARTFAPAAIAAFQKGAPEVVVVATKGISTELRLVYVGERPAPGTYILNEKVQVPL